MKDQLTRGVRELLPHNAVRSAEEIYRREGLERFHDQERESAEIPLNPGPFKGFLEALHRIQKLFPEDTCPIRTALVTARSAPAHKRAI